MDGFFMFLNHNGPAIQVILTAALVFITLLYVIFTYWLVRESRNNRDISSLPVLTPIELKSTLENKKRTCAFKLKNIGQSPALMINVEFSDPSKASKERKIVGHHYIEHLSPNQESDLIKFTRDVEGNNVIITKVDILSTDISNKKISTYFPIFMNESSDSFVFVNSYKSKRIKNEFKFWKDKAIFFPSRKFLATLGGDKVLYKKLLKRYWCNKLKEIFPTFYYLLGLSRHKDN